MSMEKQEQGGPPKNDDRGGYEEPQVLQGMQSGEGGVNQYGLRWLTAPISLWSFRVPVIEIVRLAYLTNSSPSPRLFLILRCLRCMMVGIFFRKGYTIQSAQGQEPTRGGENEIRWENYN